MSLGDRVRHAAQLADAGGGVDGARLVERGRPAWRALGRLAERVGADERLALVGGGVDGDVHGVREHGDQDGDAEQEPELARRVEHARPGALDAAGHDAHAGGEQRRQGEPDAGADQRAAPEHRAERGGAVQVAERDEAGGATSAPAHRRQARPEPVGEPAGERA